LKLFQELGVWIKENGRGDEFKYDIFNILRTFANATMYSPPAQQLKKREMELKNRKKNKTVIYSEQA
jgi:hypothetical protein